MKGPISFLIGGVVKFIQVMGFILFGAKRFGLGARINIVRRILAAHRANPGKTASSLGEQLYLVRTILNLPGEQTGAIAEFGCFKGMSTVAISIAAKYTNRRVLVFDSFEGLPSDDVAVHQMASGRKVDYKKGDYAGTLDEVTNLVRAHGEISQVDFIKGYFCNTLPLRAADEKYCLIFEDADLVSSVRDVLLHAWPRLNHGGIFFCHEALDLEVVKLFFDQTYWEEKHQHAAPGLSGAGMGLPIDWGRWGGALLYSRMGSCLAATIKP